MVMVAVTGGGSTLGLLVLARLRARGHLAHALDVQRPETEAPFRPTSPDGTLRSGSLEDIQMAVHLLQPHESTRDPSQDAADMERTRSLLREVEAAGCDTVILVSSATVYGAHEDNPVPLREDAPLRADPAFPFAWHKRLADELVQEWAQAHPHIRVVTLRPVTVLGEGHEDFVARHLESPRLPLVRGHMPPMQALHAKDLVEAVTVAIERHDLRGPCNVAPDGWLTAEEVCQILRRKPLRLPETVAFPLARRAWRTHMTAAPEGGLPYLMHPWVVDTRKLRDAGWRPRFTNREVLEAFTRAHHGHLVLGPVRTSRGVVAAAGVGAAALIGVLLRRLRRA